MPTGAGFRQEDLTVALNNAGDGRGYVRWQVGEHLSQLNQELLWLIPPDAKIVVEVGCGSGALGKDYLRINPSCRYIGIEMNPAAAAVARSFLGEVQAGDIQTLELDADEVECLVYGDILQHMTDPWDVLRRHAASLRYGGQVVACIPNIGHWSNIAELIREPRGDRPEGLTDENYLRFFTLEGIRDLFARVGLNVFEVRSRSGNVKGIEEFRMAVQSVAKRMGIEFGRFEDRVGAAQFIVRAVKGPVPQRILLHSFLGEPKVCAPVRILEPHGFLATIPGVRVRSEVKTAHLEAGAAGEAKIFLWQRSFFTNIAQQEALILQGYLVLAEMDDDPLRWPSHSANDFLMFRSCHGVQVSTEPLGDLMRQYNPNVAVFPNQLTLLPDPRCYGDEPVVTLFFGALNREADWLPVMESLNAVLEKFRDRIRVVVVHDRKFFNELKTSDKEFSPFCPYIEYIAALRRADIAILPLQPTRFNRMKSDLKFLECAAHGVATLASPTVYEQSIVDGETGLLYRDPGEFADKLALLIADTDFRRRISVNAYHWVARHRLLRDHYRQRYEWYLSMCLRLPELNESMRLRLKG